jgi:hypothetical protein
MGHLSTETLAALVDEKPRPEEAQHLQACDVCREELAALRAQTEALRALPEIRPPQGDWRVLEARLRSEGLVRDPGLADRLRRTRTPAWMKVAAAALLFLSGAGTGFGFAQKTDGGRSGDLASLSNPEIFATSTNVDDAASTVRIAEQNYMTALARYREMLSQEGGDESVGDPMSRYAALQTLAAVSQAAVRQAPGDPYLNGLLASVLGEREATARLVSARRNNWF